MTLAALIQKKKMKTKEEEEMAIYTIIVFGVGTIAGAVVACVTAAGSYGKGYEEGYAYAWSTRDIIDRAR